MSGGKDSLFERGGEMAGRMARLDWSATPLGPPASWPQSLRAVVRVMLTSRYAMWMGWGPQLTFFCNDAYSPTLGVKQSWALGTPARKVWEEIWPDIGPRIDRVLKTGDATWDEALLLFLERSGYPEETYHTFSYSPLSDDEGRVSGMLCVVTEETERVIGERRLAVLRDLASELATSKTEPEVFAAADRCLAHASRDFPFALTYLTPEGGGTARLASNAGCPVDSPMCPSTIDRNGSDNGWPISEALVRNEPILDDLSARFPELPRGPWPRSPRQALIFPLAQAGQLQPVGLFIVGLDPFRPFDATYRSFVELFAGQLTAGLNNAHAYEAERKRAEALAEIDRAKTAFFSNVSHEFRTPLTLMLGPLLDTLAQQNGPLPPRVAEELTVVHRNGLRLLKLVNTLLDFSRIEAGRVQAAFVPTDLARFTTELASVFRSAVEKAGLSLTIETPPLGEPALVDRDMWEKIVLNLISNAFKFTLEGKIGVRLVREGQQFRLTVEDTGSGIPSEELPRLFERFHRVEGTRGRTHEGTGIGLALVQELVKIHGGTVAVESEYGRGSTFTVTIPVGREHLPADRIATQRVGNAAGAGFNAFVEEALRWLPASETELESGGDTIDGIISDTVTLPGSRLSVRAGGTDPSGPLVLVADDNADVRDYLRRLLEERYHVVTAPDGEEALKLAAARMPALILSDVMMPRLDGFGLLKAVRADAALAAVPVVLLSARAGEEATLDGIRAGADDYLVKPFSARERNARVDALIERKRFERQLASAEQRLQAALRAAHMAAWEWDPATDTASSSVTAAEVYGLPLGQLYVASSVQRFSLVHPDDLERHRALVRAAGDEGHGYQSEFRIIRPRDGRVAWLEERAQAISDPETGKTRLVGLVTDVTARKESEIALRRSEQRARFIVRLDDVLRPLVDPHEIARKATRVLNEYLGCDRSLYVEVQPDEDQCVITGQYSSNLPSLLSSEYRISECGADYVATLRAKRPCVESDTTRESLPAVERQQFAALQIGSFISAPVFKDEKLVAILVAHDTKPRPWRPEEIEDVSLVAGRSWDSIGRARVTQALAASEERLAFAIEAGELGTFYCPMPLGPIIWNDKCKEHFWLPDDAEVNLDLFYSRLHEKDRDRTRAAVESAVYHRQPYDVEYRTVAPDGRTRWLRAKGRAYYDQGGAPIRFDGVTLDITELKLNERNREAMLAAERAAREEAERVNRMKDEFLATLSHELRTPLNAILGWSQILRRGSSDEEDTRQGLEAIERNARSQTQMIEDLLDMSRIISGKVRLDVQRLVLAEVVTAAVQSVRPSAEVKGVRLVTVLDPYAGPVAGDAGRLQQVVWNLLTNAIKFTRRGGQVQVSLERVNSHLELSVSDTGEGITPDFLPHVFERFRQADASTTRRHGGLGLGLSIVKQLVELHGGKIRATSAGTGRGATFSITLPVAIAEWSGDVSRGQGQHPSRHSDLTLPEPPDLRGLKVLVVDDDADARTVLQRILSSGGATVATASSAADALQSLRSDRPDLLLSDIGMPGEDGYELIRKVRALPPEAGGVVPAVALTAFARSEDRQRALRAGFQIHVAKPVEPSELLTVCASLVGRLV